MFDKFSDSNAHSAVALICLMVVVLYAGWLVGSFYDDITIHLMSAWIK